MVLFIFFISALCFVIFPDGVQSEIIIRDVVAPTGKEVMLKAEVKGKVFSKGGALIEFFVNGKPIGRTLSGGDGLAFKQFIPFVTGMYQTKAKSGIDEDRGLLLSIKKGSGIVFIDVEGSLMKRFSDKPKQGSQKIIKNIQKNLPVVLLQTTGFLNIKSIREWLKKNEFPGLPVLPWKQGLVFDDFHDAHPGNDGESGLP